MRETQGIYLHIPFCTSKCSYCDFLTMVPKNSLKIDEYVNFLLKEIEYSSGYTNNKNVDTIYFGGGTPSLLSVNNLDRILSQINRFFSIDKDSEITIEINPETVNENWVKGIASIGINRASVGFQNSNQNILNLLGRKSSLKEFINLIENLKKNNITNISTDVILSLPYMDVDKTLFDAKILSGLEIPHISAYSLILEEKTRLFRQVKEKKVILPDDETERKIYHSFYNYLCSKGYERYEVSSFCKPGFESKHNSRYWDLSEYMGLGLGASGLIGNFRTKNPIKLNEYYKRINSGERIFDIEYKLELKDKMSEFSFLSIRTTRGIDKKEFKSRFKYNFESVFNLDSHYKNGLITSDERFIKLTDKGFDLSNIVEQDLIL